GSTRAPARAEPHLGVRLDEKHDGDRKELTAVQAHLSEHAPVVRPGHEAVERRDPAGGHEFQVVESALGKLNGWKAVGARAELGASAFGDDQVDERSPDGLDESRRRCRHVALPVFMRSSVCISWTSRVAPSASTVTWREV